MSKPSKKQAKQPQTIQPQPAKQPRRPERTPEQKKARKKAKKRKKADQRAEVRAEREADKEARRPKPVEGVKSRRQMESETEQLLGAKRRNSTASQPRGRYFIDEDAAGYGGGARQRSYSAGGAERPRALMPGADADGVVRGVIVSVGTTDV